MRTYLANMLLRDGDFMSMAHSLEVRVPFVDSVLVPFVLQLPGKWKLDGHRPKPLLLDALGDLLPEEIWRRPKKGFTLPFEHWMRSSLRPELDRTFGQEKFVDMIGINPEFPRKLWGKFQKSPRKERWSRPWALYVLSRWCEINKVKL